MARNKSRNRVPQPKKLHKDPGIPKLISLESKAKAAAYKHSLLQSSNGSKRAVEIKESLMEVVPSMSTLAAKATLAEETALAESLDGETNEVARAAVIQRRQYLRTLHKVIDQSDVVIMVLDARDPEGCRSQTVVDEVRRREGDGKRLIFVLNKIDLVPRENAEAWLRYLRHSAPTLPFRSSTQSQRNHLSSKTSPALLNLLKSFKPPNRSISVGVVGYPNVGKSSLINSLKRARVCPVAAEPGWTKDIQSISIDRGLKIIDSPGVIFDDISPDAVLEGTSQASRILLLNVFSPSSVADPLAVVQIILSRTPVETLQSLYKLPPFPLDDANTFLAMLALTTGRLKQGGTPDLEASAKQVMHDWNSAKIPYFSTVPEVHPSMRPSDAPGAEGVGEMRIVDGWKPAFDLAGLFAGADEAAWGEEQADGDEQMVEDRIDASETHLPQITLKRSVSSREERYDPAQTPLTNERTQNLASNSEELSARRAKARVDTADDMDLDAETTDMAINNPMSRKNQRRNAKKERKHSMRVIAEEGDGMTIEPGGSLDNEASI